jgi:hypothetical protein
MVERFNGRISELLQQTRFDSAADLEKTSRAAINLEMACSRSRLPTSQLDRQAKTPPEGGVFQDRDSPDGIGTPAQGF